MKANVILFEIMTFILFLVFYRASSRAMGKRRNRTFFAGAVLFSLAIQTAAVLGGIMNFYWYSINHYYKSYPLGGYTVWLGVTPLAACLLWYMVTAISQMVSTAIAREAKLISRSAFAGAIAVGFYTLIEPVAVTNHWWTWNLRSFYVIDIPLVALFAVFGSVFLFNMTYGMTVLEPEGHKFLKRFEGRIINRLLFKSDKHANYITFDQIQRLFFFRLFLALVAFSAFIAPVIVIFWAIANRGQIPPGW
ncbi:MAG: hypothetical protein CVT63_04625 [Candidatus Anoxymicrobium japonicum]|uniref:Uncharacterized protein n=1 Tax=Candidatus Anoxymicrobium japonicum TaxID=2013648 RepID=A0A2N3G659_9ACTN|nr:MAG: hypothetical protein CVT63_04625 [Candidatus Anoxymicrobium japonicum]